MLVCWSVGGGVGTSVIVAGLAAAAARAGERSLVLDLAGDQATLFGAPDPGGPGLSDWLGSTPDVPVDALRHLEVGLVPGVSLLPRGAGGLEASRIASLSVALEDDERFVVVDAGSSEHAVAAQLVATASRTLLVVRACPIALRRLEHLPMEPTGIVVVRERRRSVTWQDIATAAGAPVVAELEIDPGVAAAVDAGLDRRPLPRSFLRVLDGLR